MTLLAQLLFVNGEKKLIYLDVKPILKFYIRNICFNNVINIFHKRRMFKQYNYHHKVTF